MKSNAASGLTGIEIVVVTALTMIAVALISPVISARGQAAKTATQQAGHLQTRHTRYQIDNVDEGLLLEAGTSPEASNNDLLVARKQALILAGKIKPDSVKCVSDVVTQAAVISLNAGVANARITKAQIFSKPRQLRLAVADVL